MPITEHWFGPHDTPEGYGYFALGYSPWHSKEFPMWYAQTEGNSTLADITVAASQFVVEGIETEEKRWVDIYLVDQDGRVHATDGDIIRVGIAPPKE